MDAVMILRKTLIFTLMLLIFPAASYAVSYEEISALTLYEKIQDKKDDGYIIIDIRERVEFDAGHILGAINIPLRELGYRFIEIDKTKDIIVYCNEGLQSKIACQVLVNVGFKDVYNLTGGLSQWNYALVTSNGGMDV